MVIASIFFFLIIALAISHFLGKKRQIGFGWSLFFCVFLTIFGGFIITMLSPKYYDSNPTPSKIKLVLGWILGLLFGLISAITIFAILGDFDSFMRVSQTQRFVVFNQVIITIGISGLGFYLIGLAKGKNFNLNNSVTNTK